MPISTIDPSYEVRSPEQLRLVSGLSVHGGGPPLAQFSGISGLFEMASGVCSVLCVLPGGRSLPRSTSSTLATERQQSCHNGC